MTVPYTCANVVSDCYMLGWRSSCADLADTPVHESRQVVGFIEPVVISEAFRFVVSCMKCGIVSVAKCVAIVTPAFFLLNN